MNDAPHFFIFFVPTESTILFNELSIHIRNGSVLVTRKMERWKIVTAVRDNFSKMRMFSGQIHRLRAELKQYLLKRNLLYGMNSKMPELYIDICNRL